MENWKKLNYKNDYIISYINIKIKNNIFIKNAGISRGGNNFMEKIKTISSKIRISEGIIHGWNNAKKYGIYKLIIIKNLL